MAHLLFSYGTLRLPSVQQAVFGGPIPGEPDAVIGFELSELRITDPSVIAASGSDVHPALIPSSDPTATVDGTVFTLDDAQLAAADAYEVEAYVRVSFPLRSGRQAWVYALGDTAS
ncbi:gamma-glutamylcyclotransferase family protein [Leifsonia sp. NPDC058292]|uniref:gamma-glutamylcyclotransferase family protein n=1 Tax=Leifsonia sp. NPDC058292 TaxID=3346428 RepID=UPI0036DE9FAF